MKSTFILASLLSLAIAAPLVPPPDDPEACAYELGFCVTSEEGKCACERANVDKVNAKLKAAGCTKVVEVSDQCGVMSILPVDPIPATGVYPTGTATATPPTITGPANGTQSCGRGMPKCPTGYHCDEKRPGEVADYMFCFIDTKIETPTPTTTALPEYTMRKCFDCGTLPSPPPKAEGRVCGGFAGVECPTGFTCEIAKGVDGAVVNDAQGVCKAESKVCGGIAGVKCPRGFTCEFEEVPYGTVVSDAQGTCKTDTIITK